MNLTNVYIAGLNPGEFTIVSNGCLPSNATLNAGASCSVDVAFAPTAKGLRQANLSFSGNAPNTTDLSVALTGLGTDNTSAAVTVSPTSLAFGAVNGGSAPELSLNVTNTGTGNSVTIAGATLTGTATADFTITLNDCANKTLSPGNSCAIKVTFRPGGLGARAATLTLSHTAAGPTSATSTSVALSGTGGSGSVLSFSSNPVQIGTQKLGSVRDQTVTVKNAGNATASLSLASFATTGAQYSLVSTDCAALLVNKTCNVVVRFTAPNTAGTFNGKLSVTASNGMPTTVTTDLIAGAK
jgi:hypothetical protein